MVIVLSTTMLTVALTSSFPESTMLNPHLLNAKHPVKYLNSNFAALTA